MKLLYRVGRAVAAGILHLGGVQIIGRENIPDDKSLLIICNHVSYADPLAVAIVYPRQLSFVAKEGFKKKFYTRWLYGYLGALFLSKDENDLSAMRAVIKKLKSGCAVVIFPEGTRRFDQNMVDFKAGASYLSQRTRARVLPMAVLNTGDFWRIWKRNIIIMIGEPIEPPSGRLDNTVLTEYTQLYQSKVGQLVEQARQILQAQGKKMRQIPRKRKDEYKEKK